MQPEKLYHLISKYLDGFASEEEMQLVDKWYDAFEERPAYYVAGSKSLPPIMKDGFRTLQITLGEAGNYKTL